MYNSSKKAFTLIELSIVLIIIGLLIIAVISGSSLVRSSKLRALTNESSQYQVAVNAFFMKFNRYPGDFTQQIAADATPSIAGNGDFKLEWLNSDKIPEASNAWLHLIDSFILPTDTIKSINRAEMLSTTGDNIFVSGIHFPASSEGSSGWIFGHNTQTNKNYLYLTASGFSAALNATTATSAPPANAALTASDARSIDIKNDDGNPKTGNIIDIANDQKCRTAVDSNLYNLAQADDDNVCVLTFNISVN